MQPTQFSRRGFFQGLGSLVGASVIGCAGEPQTPKVKFRRETYASLTAQHSAGLAISGNRLLTLSAPNRDLTNGLGDRNQLVEAIPGSAPRALLDLPNQDGLFTGGLMLISPEIAFVTGSELYEVAVSSPVVRRAIPLASGNMRSNGSLPVGDKLFVTASNPITLIGALNVYNLAPDGTIVGSGRAIDTEGLNPTGLARFGSEVLVLDTGAYRGDVVTYLNFFDANGQRTRAALPLGTMTTQSSGSIAVVQDTAVIGTSDRSGRLIFVDLNGAQIIDETETRLGRSFHSSVAIGNVRGRDYAFATDYESGLIDVFDVESRELIDTVDLGTGRAGPALFHEGALIQTVPNAALRVYAG